MLVTVYVEYGLTWESPILVNEPRPLTARVPIWVRPYTTVFTARARSAEQYGVDVVYKLEAGVYCGCVPECRCSKQYRSGVQAGSRCMVVCAKLHVWHELSLYNSPSFRTKCRLVRHNAFV